MQTICHVTHAESECPTAHAHVFVEALVAPTLPDRYSSRGAVGEIILSNLLDEHLFSLSYYYTILAIFFELKMMILYYYNSFFYLEIDLQL